MYSFVAYRVSNKVAMGIVRTTRDYAWRTHGIVKLIMLHVCDIIIHFVISYSLSQLAKTKDMTYIRYIVFFKMFSPIIRKSVTYNRAIISNEMKKLFYADAIKKYNTVSYRDKNMFLQANLFHRKVIKACFTILMMVDWGMDSVFNIISTFGGCIITFYNLELSKVVLVLLVVYILFYYFIIRKKQKAMSALRKLSRKECDKIDAHVELILPSFQYKETTPEYVIGLHDSQTAIEQNAHASWSCISALVNFMSEYSTVIMYMTSMKNIEYIPLIGTFMGSLNSSVKQATAFFNNYNRMCDDYETYTDCWKKVKFDVDPEKIPLPRELHVLGVDIKQGDFRTTIDENVGPIAMGLGQKIKIEGKSGSGKSTFLAGLTGKIDGVLLDKNSPDNYYHTIADMYQDIREKIPTSAVTIRQWFRGASDEDIDYCMKFCFPSDELITFKKNFIPIDDTPKDFVVIEMEHSPIVNPYDVEILERLCGGQKSRLCLATRVYEMIIHNKQILILDEPDQGVDADTAIWMLNNIFKRFTDRTIIMITHMCSCNISKLDIHWDTELVVANGVIHRA